MPPKGNQPNKKTAEKAKAKVVEDKTFGLKNKKGAKQQKFIDQVVKQVANKGQQNRRELDPAAEREKKKEEERKKKEELAMLFKPVITQTVAKGVDPKSVLCQFFKAGSCQKGDKCKFSHDLTKERKSEKRSVYDDGKQEEEDTMDKWDTTKLEDVVNKKHGEENKANSTQIVCKYFIEAVENATYGWFWTCPNEKDEKSKCIYRHALPPGFQLKSDKKKDEKEEIALEALIETERAGLGSNVTKVTLESFLAWKARKLQEKKDKVKEQEDKKKRDFKLGFMNGLTGRDIFTFNPDLIANDDDEATNDVDYKLRADEDEDENGENGGEVVKVREINLDALSQLATDVDGTGTVATSDRFDYIKTLIPPVTKKEEKLAMACGGGELEDIEDDDEEEEEEEEEEENGENDEDEETTQEATAAAATNGKPNNKNIEIDESLFTLEDLSNIQDELENLDI